MKKLLSAVVILTAVSLISCLPAHASNYNSNEVVATGASVSAFNDIPSNSWFNDAVKLLKNLSILSGYPDQTFRAETFMNRAEVATVLERLLLSVTHPFDNNWQTIKLHPSMTFKIPGIFGVSSASPESWNTSYSINSPFIAGGSTWEIEYSESNHFTLEAALEDFYRTHEDEITEVQDLVINKVPAKKITIFTMSENNITQERTYILLVNKGGTVVVSISGRNETPMLEKAFQMFYMSVKGIN